MLEQFLSLVDLSGHFLLVILVDVAHLLLLNDEFGLLLVDILLDACADLFDLVTLHSSLLGSPTDLVVKGSFDLDLVCLALDILLLAS